MEAESGQLLGIVGDFAGFRMLAVRIMCACHAGREEARPAATVEEMMQPPQTWEDMMQDDTSSSESEVLWVAQALPKHGNGCK